MVRRWGCASCQASGHRTRSWFAIAVLLSVAAYPATTYGQIPDSSLNACDPWLAPPGFSSQEDRGWKRCALDSGPVLLTRDVYPPSPRIEVTAHGRMGVFVQPDGSVDPEFTRALTIGVDTVFNRQLRETILTWRFEPGVRDGTPVRSGFILQIRSSPRTDTLPQRLSWTYSQGVNEDRLVGSWVAAPSPPPLSPEQVDSVHAAMLRHLVATGVLIPNRQPGYCIVLQRGDSAALAHLLKLANRTLSVGRAGHFGLAGLAGSGCESRPGPLRLVIPHVHRTEGDRAVLYPAGDHLRAWPAGFEARTWRAWTGRCIATVPVTGTVDITCDVGPDLSAEPLEMPRPLDLNPFGTPAAPGEELEMALLMPSPRGLDTLSASTPGAVVLSEKAIRSTDLTNCGWAAYSPQDSARLLIVKIELRHSDPERSYVAVRPIATSRAPPSFGGSGCRRDTDEMAAFLLGDIADPITEPVTLCLGEPACTRNFVLDPARHTLAPRAQLRARVADVNPGMVSEGRFSFRIYTNREAADVYPLIVIGDGDQWGSWFGRRIGPREWSFGLNTNRFRADPEIFVYLVRIN